MKRHIHHPISGPGLFAILLCCLVSCSSTPDPPGRRTLTTYELPNNKEVRIVYADSKAQSGHSILVELASKGKADSLLYRLDDYKFLQFSHIQHDSGIIVAVRRDTTVVNLDTYIIPIPQ